jgi:NTP pyrophosphatase (non-canonical NTP hydrolase)
MEFNDYQRIAAATDQYPERTTDGAQSGVPDKAELIPLLGMVGEVGTLVSEYKKVLRDGPRHAHFADQLGEELGDILWYVASVASKFGLRLDDVAKANLAKIGDRWTPSNAQHFYDDGAVPSERLPRSFTFTFAYADVGGRKKVVLLDSNGEQVGDPLTDNVEGDDGYRFHDVFHLALVAVLGWSPIMRKLMGRKRKSDPVLDETQDGGRAGVIDEAVVALLFEYARRHNFLEGLDRVDWELLRTIQRMVASANLEVRDRSAAEWEQAILQGLAAWRLLRQHDGGTIEADATTRSLRFVEAPS